MRLRIKLATLAVLCGFATYSHAQAPAGNGAAQAQSTAPAAAPAPAVRVGVIDIGYIFDNHPTMKAQIAQIDAKIKAAEDEINKRREEMLKELDALKQFNENTPEYKKKEEYIADQESKLKLDFVRQEKEFALSKAKVVFDTYKQVEWMTKAVAEANQFGAVLRYSRQEMDPAKPQTVQGGINKDVVYFSPSNDLTDYILGVIKQQAGATQQPTTPAANPGAPRTATPANGLPRR